MNKLIMLILLIAINSAEIARADEYWHGNLSVDSIVICQSNCQNDVPTTDCNLLIHWVFNSGQGPYLLPASATGTLINAALLTAYNSQLTVDARLSMVLYPWTPPCPLTFHLQIEEIEFGSRTFPLQW